MSFQFNDSFVWSLLGRCWLYLVLFFLLLFWVGHRGGVGRVVYLRVEKVLIVVWITIDRWRFCLDGVETLDEFHQRRQLTLQQIENVQVIGHRGGLARIIRLLDGWPEWNLFEPSHHHNTKIERLKTLCTKHYSINNNNNRKRRQSVYKKEGYISFMANRKSKGKVNV